MLKYKTINLVEVQDFDKLVEDTYGRPYSFQQQAGCKSRGVEWVCVPDTVYDDPEDWPDEIPLVVNGDEMGVSFKSWLAKDPKSLQSIIWERNFYPNPQEVLNDLHNKGLIEPGEYLIHIDW
jgi:hypothetical protein